MSLPATFDRMVSTTAPGSRNCLKRGGRSAAVTQFNKLRSTPPRRVPVMMNRRRISSSLEEAFYLWAWRVRTWSYDGNPEVIGQLCFRFAGYTRLDNFRFADDWPKNSVLFASR